MGPAACSEFATELGVWRNQLWGSVCNLLRNGEISFTGQDGTNRLMPAPTPKGRTRYYRVVSKQNRRALRLAASH